jgi:hypothetical protein
MRPLAQGSPKHHVTTAAPNLRRVVVQGGQSSPQEWLRLRVDPTTKDVFAWESVPYGT